MGNGGMRNGLGRQKLPEAVSHLLIPSLPHYLRHGTAPFFGSILTAQSPLLKSLT